MFELNKLTGSRSYIVFFFLSCDDLVVAWTKRLKLRPSGGDAFFCPQISRPMPLFVSLVCGGEKVDVAVDVGARIISDSKRERERKLVECRLSDFKQAANNGRRG